MANYYLAFDISQRTPAALLLVPAMAILLAILLASLRPASRDAMRRFSPAMLLVVSVLWIAVNFDIFEGYAGIVVGGVVGTVLAILAVVVFSLGTEFIVATDVSQIRAGVAAVLLATGVSALLVVEAYGQLSSFGLERQLADGRVDVLTGVVEQATDHGWSGQCFVISERQFCYNDGPTFVGFHQSASNGGPIRDGLAVRVTYVGDVIVRLEIATGQ